MPADCLLIGVPGGPYRLTATEIPDGAARFTASERCSCPVENGAAHWHPCSVDAGSVSDLCVELTNRYLQGTPAMTDLPSPDNRPADVPSAAREGAPASQVGPIVMFLVNLVLGGIIGVIATVVGARMLLAEPELVWAVITNYPAAAVFLCGLTTVEVTARQLYSLASAPGPVVNVTITPADPAGEGDR
jgi:hypothetical protein